MQNKNCKIDQAKIEKASLQILCFHMLVKTHANRPVSLNEYQILLEEFTFVEDESQMYFI